MFKLLIILISVLIIGCSSAEKKVEEPILIVEEPKVVNNLLTTAMNAHKKSVELYRNVDYLKGFNSNDCISSRLSNQDLTIPERILSCVCVEEVKLYVLKDKYLDESIYFRNKYIDNLCIGITQSYTENPEMFNKMIEENISIFVNEPDPKLLKNEITD